MPPNIDWNILDGLVDGSSVIDEVVDKVIEDLRSIQEPDFKDDPEKMYLLFKSALKVYDFREQETEELLDEQAKTEAEQDRKITELQQQLRAEQNYTSAAGQGDVDFWRDKHRDLTDLLEDYKAKEDELKAELTEANDDKARIERECNDFKRDNKNLKSEVQDLRVELREFQQIFESQRREKLEAKGTYDSELSHKLTEKNNQISDLIEQITQLERLNKELEEKNHGVRDEMEQAREDMTRMADEYEKMKKIVDGTDKYSENIHKENETAKLQVADLRDQLKRKNEEVDEIVQAVNDKVEEWKRRISEKDRALVENARTIATLQDRIKAAALDEDRIKVDRMTRTLREKEDQIKQLQTSLEQVIADLNEQTAIVQDLRKEFGTNKEMLAYKNQIKAHQDEIKRLKDAVEEASSHRLAAEVEARQKDGELNKANKRIDDILSGEYGLAEAVQEIKEGKAQIKYRDQDVEDLTRQVNQVEEKLNDVLDENDEFRDRLGLDPRDMTDIAKMRKSRALRQQQYRAENQILLKEIERLEDERIEMKQMIRSQAQTYSQRALSEGLHQDDVELIEEFIEELKRKRRIGKPMVPKNRAPGGPLLQKNWREDELNKHADKVETNLEMSRMENARLNQERNNFAKENADLKNAMKEILEAIKNSKENGTSGAIEIASLERLLHAIEVQNMRGQYDSGLHLKAQVDQLTGRNDELRRELRSARTDLAAATGAKAALTSQNETLATELSAFTKQGKRGNASIYTVPLPGNIDPTATDVITALNEQLIQVMDDLSKRNAKIEEITERLEQSRRRYHVLKHQTHAIYAEHFKEKKKWEDEREKQDKDKDALMETIEKETRLLDSLEQDPDALKQRLAETTRKISLLRVNEKTLIRRHKASEFSEEQLQNENSRLRNSILQMEKAVSERLGYLQRYKDMASYKIAVLQKAVDASVPETELVKSNKEYDELTAKYRDLLQKENHYVARNTKLETLQAEVKLLNEELSVLRNELAIEKEKRHKLGEALSRAESSSTSKYSASASTDSLSYEMSSVLKKVTVLEMKELNERQKADHASRMYEQIKSSVDSVETRNAELEQKFAELTQMNLASQRAERELRDELSAAVPLSVSEADRKKIAKLEEDIAKMKIRKSQLEDMADIAQNQLKTLQLRQQGREREMRSLRDQVREFQIQSDNKSLIGKLHKQILNLQASEADRKLELDKTASQVKKLEAHVLRQEKMIDEKEIVVFHVRTETTNRNRQLKKTIQSLRQQFSGALPLQQQEKFSQSMIRLQEDKHAVQEELKRVRREREKLEDELAEARVKEEGLQELKKTIKDGRGAQKLEEWCRKMDALRLQDLKLQRQVVRQTDEIAYMEKVNAQHEKTIATREEDIVEMLRNQEKQQLEWEQRETELERMIDNFDVRQREVVKHAKRLDDIPDLLPDPTLPLDIQLTRALKQISDLNKKHKDLVGQIKFYESDANRLKNRIHVLEGDVFARDRMVNDLRLRIPESGVARQVTIAKSESQMGGESAKQLHVAKETIETLKKRLRQKEESLERFKKLLEESRRDYESAVKQHENELSSMQRRIHSKADDAFGKFRKSAADGMQTSGGRPMSGDRLKRMSELEQLTQQQDNALTLLMDRVKAAHADIRKQKEALDNSRRQAEKERNKIIAEYDTALKQVKDALSGKEKSIDQLEMKYAKTQADLQNQRDSNNKNASAAMKGMVDRMKAQIEEKDAKQKRLSQVISELRADMVQQAQENLRAANEGSNTNAAVQALVQKKTEAYRDEIDDLKDKVAILQRSLKQERAKHETMNSELKKMLGEVERKSSAIDRLKGDKLKADQENEKLRDKLRRYVQSSDTAKRAVQKPPAQQKPDSDESDDDDDDDNDNIPVKESLVTPADAAKSETQPPAGDSVSYHFGVDNASRIRDLESEVEKLTTKLEQAAAPEKNELEFVKWETKKLWQGRVENLRVKLQDKERDVRQLEKQIASLRETVSRLEREKTRKVVGFHAPIHAVARDSEPPAVTKAARDEAHRIEELSLKLHELGEENSKLRTEKNLPRNVLVAEMEARNKSLSERLEALEREMTAKGARPHAALSADQLHRDRESKFQSELLKLYSENAELKFQVEQSKIDLPRLRDRISDQQRYIELLKAEKREAEVRADRHRAAGQAKKGGKDAGTTGRSPAELERMIGMLKKVVERVQRENETLKKAPGVVSNEVMESVRKENAQLKQRIDMMSRQIGGQLSSRYESKTLGVEKLMKENARLQRELAKESNGHEKLKASKASLQNLYEKQKSENDNLKERLRNAESRASRAHGLGSKGRVSATSNKTLEMKLSQCRAELDGKNSQIQDLRVVFEDSTKRVEEARRENEALKQQIEILERFPAPAGGVDAGTVRELQRARVEIARLLKTKEDLEGMMRVLRRQDTPSTDKDVGSDVTDDDALLKLRRYDETQEKNVKLNADLALTERERDRLAEENDRLEKALSEFNDDFFNEIDDMKYNYTRAVKRNVLYEEQLKNFAERFNVEIEVPDEDDSSVKS